MNVSEFTAQLLRQERLYESTAVLPAACVHLRFTGPFEHKIIIWDAEIATLAYYFSSQPDKTTEPAPIRPFIEIGASSEHGRLLQIGLNVTTIDVTTIHKCMIMIRQYKRLQTGRHEFGESYCPPRGP